MAMTKDRRERLQYVRGILEGLSGSVALGSKSALKAAFNAIEAELDEDLAEEERKEEADQ